MILAPIVASRKGEQHELVASELRAQGSRACGVDARSMKSGSVRRLSKNDQSTRWTWLVDRLKVAPRREAAPGGILPKQALKARRRPRRGARARVGPRSTVLRRAMPSPFCDYSLPELERACSPSTTPWAPCPECDGLGTITFFDPKRVVAHPASPRERRDQGLDRRNQFYFQMLTSLAAHFRFDVGRAAFEKLPEPVQTLVLPPARRKRSRSPT